MKYRTTKKDVSNGYYYKIVVGYGGLQNLLNLFSPVAYTCGQYGWNADIYYLSDLTGYNAAIITGYRPFGNIRGGYEMNKEYDQKAEKIRYDYKRDFDERKEEVRALLKEYALKLIEQEKAKKPA